ncbi:acyl-CoA dehydrogenase family protein [Geodermatophilus maliterrae]|uniref:Acyl-CoA dehydrogenase n=1 Tax=Geodermatophilus maliterrae TaxID=3162531 RepID=A0ABV3XJ01_9ACTN
MTQTLPTTVDPAHLRDVLDGRWAHVRRQAREQLGPQFAPVYGETVQEARERITRLSRALAATGQVSLGFPKEYGGEADAGGSVTSIEMLAQGDLSLMVKAGVQWGLFGGAVQLLGTRRHHDAYLRDIMSFDLPGCFAMTETGHGSDVQQLRTTCTYDPGTQTFDLHTPHEAARKDYIGNAAKDGRMAVVFAQLVTQGQRRGVHAWLVPIRDERGDPCPGVTIGDDGPKAGLLGVDNGRLAFDHVRVPREMLLDRYGQVAEDGTYTSSIENETRRFFTMLGTLVRGRVSVGGAASAATRVALDIAVRYGDVRRQFTAPGHDREVVLNDYLVHQRRLLPALATSYGLAFAQEELVGTMHDIQTAVHEHGQEVDEAAQRELESRAAGLKVAQTWHATRTIQTCREACGGAGYLAENRLPQFKADTDVFTTFEGDNTVLLQLVAKGLLTGYRDAFGSLDGWGRVAFVADMVRETVLERTAARGLIARLVDAVPGRDDDVPLRDRGWQLKVFEFREKHTLEGAIRRLRRNAATASSPTRPMDPFDVFNSVQDHVLRTAQTHIDRIVLEAFVAGIERATDPAARALLDTLCDLYALSTIEADKGWLLEHGQLTPARSKAVTSTVNALLGELRPHMVTLVDGFAVPEAWKNAAILREEAGRQEAMRLEDVRLEDVRLADVRLADVHLADVHLGDTHLEGAATGALPPGDTAVTVAVPPGQ